MKVILEAPGSVRTVTAGATSLVAAMSREIGLADALGRALDKLFEARANKVLGDVITSALKVHEVDAGSMHFDMTSLSVYGEYEHIRLISHVPAASGVVGEPVAAACGADDWEPAGSYSSCKGAAEYWVSESVARIAEADYRFIVVRSSTLDSRKEKSLEKRIAKSGEEIERAAKELFDREFVCELDARRAGELFIAKWKDGFHELSFEALEETIREKRSRRGRPRKDEEVPAGATVYKTKVKIHGVDEAQVNRARERERCFVLITNVMNTKKYPAQRILGEYKQQWMVEARFSFLKSPYLLGQVFLKKQSRIEALGYVLLMALLMSTLLERRVRKNLETEEEPLMIPGQKLTRKPTARMILDMLDTAQVAYVEHEGMVRRVWRNTGRLFDVPRLLRLAGFSEEIYTDPALDDGLASSSRNH
ncbi:MAG: IS1634 family transposase [Firmicutes bacterium]|jgi:hypothetical protein|nr:IS1634 family transposase [Bacillota bacterium]